MAETSELPQAFFIDVERLYPVGETRQSHFCDGVHQWRSGHELTARIIATSLVENPLPGR